MVNELVKFTELERKSPFGTLVKPLKLQAPSFHTSCCNCTNNTLVGQNQCCTVYTVGTGVCGPSFFLGTKVIYK